MLSNLNCIVCGKELEDEFYLGEIKSMDVVFCEEHRDFCENCEVRNCNRKSCELL